MSGVRSSLFGGESSVEYGQVRFETRPNDDGTIDEVLVYHDGVCIFHLEQLDDDAYWFAWYGDGPDRERHFNIRRSKKLVHIREQA